MKYRPAYAADYSQRDPAPGVDPLFHERWSPRSFKRDALPERVVETVIDAARWSPSSFNEQPWLFITSSSETEFQSFLSLLIDKNQEWAKHASLLGFVFAKRHFESSGASNALRFFEAGTAWMAMTLQARQLGLYTHGLGGIHREKTYDALNVPQDQFEVVCGFTLGIMDQAGKLPDDLRARELPSPRKPLSEIWRKGRY